MPASPQSAELFAKLGNLSSRPAMSNSSLPGRPSTCSISDWRGRLPEFSTLVRRDARLAADFEARLTSKMAWASTTPLAPPFRPANACESFWWEATTCRKCPEGGPGSEVEILRPEAWRTGLGENFDVVVFDDWFPDGTTLDSLNRAAISLRTCAMECRRR